MAWVGDKARQSIAAGFEEVVDCQGTPGQPIFGIWIEAVP